MLKSLAQERYQATFGRAGIGIAHVALDGRWLDVNPAYCNLVGYSRAEMLRMSFQEITVPEDLDQDLENYRRVIAGETTGYTMMKRYVHKLGHQVWIDLTVTLVHPLNEEAYAVAIARDATQGRRELIALEQLVRARTRELYDVARARDAFFEVSPELLALAEIRDGEPWFRRVNPALCRLLQYSEEELTSASVYTWVYPDDLEYTRDLVRMMQTSGLPEPAQNRYVTRDGRVRWLSWSTNYVDGLYYAAARDVTEARDRARADAEQRRRLAAASKLNALGRMAANISHEIKNPLAVIYGNACQLQKALGTQVPESCQRMLGDVQAMSMRIVKIIDGLRGFSREASRDPFETVPLRKILEDTLSFSEARFTQDHLEFQCEPVADDVYLYCQPVQIQQVLLNLLNNAFDAAMETGGARKAMGISHHATAERVRICVYDSGAGVPPDSKARLFEPFFTTKQMGQGTGLGLNIAREIVTAHRGEIFLAESQPETTFVVELPRAYPSPPGTS